MTGETARVKAGQTSPATATFIEIVQRSPKSPLSESRPAAIVPAAGTGWAPKPADSETVAVMGLLQKVFSEVEQVMRFLERLDYGSQLVSDLPHPNTGMANYVHAAARGLIARGMVDRSFFEKLLDDRGMGNAASIGAAAEHLKIPLPVVSNRKVHLLMVEANPRSTSHIGTAEEIRAIQERLRGARQRDRFSFTPHPALHTGDLPRLLREHRPAVLHFSGHGRSDGIIVFNRQGIASPLSGDVLRDWLEAIEHRPRIIFLNACYTATQAQALAATVDFVVGVAGTIDDRAATLFSPMFYEALADGTSIRQAFNTARIAIDADLLPDSDRPRLLTSNPALLDVPFLEQ